MAGVLEGVRILDLSQFMAGPYATLILGDLGAEVIKIENTEGGDLSRGVKQYTHGGESVYYLSFNRNKKSLTLNLRNEEARKIFYELVKHSDVVLDNFRSGILEKFKIDYETLQKVNPRIISCSVSGFGSVSPYKDRPALDLLVQAMGGVMSFTGEPGKPPVRLGYPMGDLGGGMFAVMGVLSALLYREKTGRGQKIDIAMLDCQLSLMTYRAQYYLSENIVPEPVGSGHVSSVPIRAFRTKEGKYLTIEAGMEKFFQNLCKALQIEEVLKDPKFNSLEGRLENKDELFRILEEKFLEKNRDEWLELLVKGDVPAGPVNKLDEALRDPSILARKMVVEVEHMGEKIKMIGNPVKMSAMKDGEFVGAPTLGQHSEEILATYLGFSKDHIEELKSKGVI